MKNILEANHKINYINEIILLLHPNCQNESIIKKSEEVQK